MERQISRCTIINFRYIHFVKRREKRILLLILMLAGTWQLLPLLRAQNQNLFIISENGKFGYIDSNGHICIKPVYRYGSPAATDEVIVKNNKNRWGVIDSAGKTVLPFRYNFIYYHKPGIVTRAERKHKAGEVNADGQFILFPGKNIELVTGDFTVSDLPTPFSDNNRKWGYLDKKGEIVIKAQYEHAGSFKHGLAAVKLNGKYGFIDNDGIFVISPIYDNALEFGLHNKLLLASVRRDNMTFVIDAQGKDYFGAGFSTFHFPVKNNDWAPFTRNAKLGFIDSCLNIRIAAVLLDSIVSPGFSENHWIIPAKKDNRWGFIDTTGRFVITPVYDDASAFENGYAWVKQNGKYALLNTEGKLISDFEFTSYRHVLPGTSNVLLAAREERWAIFTLSLENKTPAVFDELRDCGQGLILARKQQRWGVVSAEGKTLVPFEFGEILVYGHTIACYRKSAADSLVPDVYFNSNGELLWLKTE